ncbi:apolipophorins [Microplitis demolitor]|uniref:apolipophorins n=1 Tax=Microplitis demolitor TaxID=69319 RepID=UPI0004CDAFAE|nr:apolipophorins [Microplitis demolitor]
MGHPPRLMSAGLITAFFACLFTTAFANQCTVGCHGMQTSKGYTQGHTYMYEYEGTSVTSVSEVEGDSSVKLSALVELAVKPDCIHQLRLKNVRVNGAPVPQKDVEKYAFQFNYHDGHIDTSVCTEPEDSQASLNIKRAISSLFQSAVMQDSGVTTHRETDVFGTCQTDFEFHHEGDSTTVRKYKNLSKCSHRENIRHALIKAIYDETSDIKSSPVLDSEQQIEQVFKQGVLQSAKSDETYKYRPFSNADTGAKTTVHSTLTFKSDNADPAAAAPVSRPRSLIFENPHPVTESSSPEAIMSALKEVKEEETPEGVKDGVAEKFGALVKVLRKSSKNHMLSAYNKVKAGVSGFDKNTDKKILIDALFRTGTGDSAEVIIELINNKEITGLYLLAYYASLSLINHVSLPTITAVTTLLNRPKLPRIAYLGIGRVIGKYCQEHDCENADEVKAALAKIATKLSNPKPDNRDQETIIIAALKALRNAKYLDDPTIDKIMGIVNDKTVHPRVRVAAIEALTAKCSPKWEHPLLKVFGDKEEDSEIRIKAYLSLVECPGGKIANELKKIIDTETVNQVGSFVTSHLRNLRASTDPNKQNAKRHFGELRPRTKFPEDFRKFSFNREFSYNIDTLGIGSVAEQNVIYSQKSFVPRSASLNLITELFGRSFNFLEIDARSENLDRLIEYYFGPKGLIKRKEAAELISDGKENFDEAYKNVKDFANRVGRNRRTVSQAELDEFARKARPQETEVDDSLDIDISIRMFGAELAYLDLQEKPGSHNSNTAMNNLMDLIAQIFDGMKNINVQNTHHNNFMDMDLVYPTGLGFPLVVGVEGNAVTQIKANGNIDMKHIMKDPKNAVVKIGLEPSANIALEASLMMETFDTESGLKIISRMHTSTGSDFSLKVLDGNGVEVNFGVPKKKQEIISLSSQVFFVDGKGNLKAPKFSSGKQHSDCFDQFSKILGVTVCGHFSYPYDSIDAVHKKPLFPLGGPAKFSISIENNDATSYWFKTYYDKSKPDERSFEMTFDTPNSRTKRRVALRIEAANKPEEKYIKASLESPIKTINGEIKLENTDKKKALSVVVNHDSDEYRATVGLQADGNKYKPILEYKIPDHIEKLSGSTSGKPVYRVEGDIGVDNQDGGKKYSFNQVSLLASDKKILGLNGFVAIKPDAIMVETTASHNDESVKISFDGKRLPEGFDTNLAVIPSKNPEVGFQVLWHYDRANNLIDHSFVVTYGPDLNSKVNRFAITDRLEYKKNDKPNHPYDYFTSLKTKSEITWPAQEVSAKFENEVSSNNWESEFDVKYGKFKIGSEIEIKVEPGAPQNWEAGFEAYMMDTKISIEGKHKKLSEFKHKFDGKLELPGSKYEVDLQSECQMDDQKKNIQFLGDFKINGKSFKVDYGLNANPTHINNHAVVSLENAKYLDYLLDVQMGPKAFGKLNLNVKNIVSANGQYNYQNGKGTGNLNINLLTMNRKMKATGDINVTGARHVGNFEINFDEKDPSKSIKMSTDTEIEKTAINSKNSIEFFTHKYEVNGKGHFKRTAENGYDFNLEGQATLPTGRHFVIEGNQVVDRSPDKSTTKGTYNLMDYEKKGGEHRKLSYDFTIALVEPLRHEYDCQHTMKFVNRDGKDVNLFISTKHAELKDNKHDCEVKVNLKGAYLVKPFDFNLNAKYADRKDKTPGMNGFWKIDSSLGSDLSFKGTGDFHDSENPTDPHVAKMDLAFVFPSEKLRNLKYSELQSILVPDESGNNKIDYKSSYMLTYNDDKTIKAEVAASQTGVKRGEVKEGKGHVSLTVLAYPPLTVETSFKHDPTGEIKKGSGTLSVNYGDAKTTGELDTAYNKDLSDVKITAKATVPMEKVDTVEFGLAHKREKDGPWNNDIYVKADDKKYGINSEFEMNPSLHRAHFIITCPSGKFDLSAKVNKLSETEYKGEWKIDSTGYAKGFAIADGHVKFDNIDSFIIEINFDSDKVQHRKIHAEITTAPAVKTGKRIVLTVTSDGKNIVVGSTNYSKRDEAGTVIVEGNGNLQIGENSRSLKFTYSRKQLTRENDGQVGTAILLNANFGPSAVVGELKLSDKEVLVFNSYCEQSKDCAHFKLQSTMDTDHKTRLDHQITVEVDLKKFNVPVEFGLKTTTKYFAEKMTFDHAANLYLHTSKDKTQYSSQIYSHPKESAVILTLPSRELALIATVDIPQSKTPMGPYKIDISAYLDRKNHPNDKTSFVANGDINVEKNAATIAGDARFIYPSQPKELMVKGKLHYGGEHLLDANVDIDLFAKKAQKITIVTHIVKHEIPKGYNITGAFEIGSRGQQLKVDLQQHLVLSTSEVGFGSFLSYTDINQKPRNVGSLFSLNLHGAHLLIQGPDKDLLRADTTMEWSKNLQKIETECSLLGNPPVVVSFEAHDLNSFKYQSYQKDKPDTKLSINGRLVVGQVAEYHADFYKNGEKKNLFSIGIYLDESRFLKPTFAYQKDNVAMTIDFYRELSVKRIEQLKEVFKAISNEANTEFRDLFEHLKKAQPNWKPALEYYQAELKKLEQELNADTTVKEIQATLNKVFGGLINAITQVVSQFMKRAAELNKQIHEIADKINDALQAVYPRIKKSFDEILHAGIEVTDAASKLAATYIKAILDIVNQHQKEIKEIIGLVSELVHDIAKIVMKGYVQIEHEVQSFIKLTTEQIQALPVYEMIKEKYQELIKFKIPDAILMPIEEAFNQLKRMLPTEELREFFNALYSYIMKHLKHQKVDDGTEIKNIYGHAVEATYSVITLLKNRGNTDQFLGLIDIRLPSYLGYVKDLPGVPILRVSLINLIRNHELPSIMDVYHAYRPTLYPSDIIPPFSKTGIVVEGGHFFTFDGRHLTLAGTCDYVLAQDTRDGNFSVVGTFNSGKLISVTITAPGESITLKNNGNILVDNKPAEYPASTKNLHAFLTLPIVNVKSDYGVHVACSQKAPMICSVRVSGFYHGKLRGIFGDADNEPYDDFTLPSGHITEKEDEFGNAYKLNPGCAAAPAVDHHHHQRNPKCTEYFSGSSSMSSCFNYVNPGIYRQACDHAMSADTPRAACLISAAYYAACRKERVYIAIPADCASCKVGKDEISIGNTFSVKIPKKEADIVFVVEQDSKNEKVFHELIVPMIAELKTELGQHGITDVHVGLIGFGEHMKWPQHYTTGGSINIDGDVKNINFSPSTPLISLEEAKEGDAKTRLKYAKQKLDIELGTFKLTDAYEEAIHYPFRAGAVKVVVGVIASPCEKSPLPLSLQHLRLFMGEKIYRDLGATYYHVGYLNDILVSGKPQKNVVGFDAESGYTFADNKKKPLEGSIDKNNLVLTNKDVCAGFAVTSGGAAFSSNHFLDAKPNQKKQFMQIMARRLAEGITDTELQEDCVCKQMFGLDGHSYCKIVGRKESAKHTKSGSKK